MIIIYWSNATACQTFWKLKEEKVWDHYPEPHCLSAFWVGRVCGWYVWMRCVGWALVQTQGHLPSSSIWGCALYTDLSNGVFCDGPLNLGGKSQLGFLCIYPFSVIRVHGAVTVQGLLGRWTSEVALVPPMVWEYFFTSENSVHMTLRPWGPEERPCCQIKRMQQQV